MSLPTKTVHLDEGHAQLCLQQVVKVRTKRGYVSK